MDWKIPGMSKAFVDLNGGECFLIDRWDIKTNLKKTNVALRLTGVGGPSNPSLWYMLLGPGAPQIIKNAPDRNIAVFVLTGAHIEPTNVVADFAPESALRPGMLIRVSDRALMVVSDDGGLHYVDVSTGEYLDRRPTGAVTGFLAWQVVRPGPEEREKICCFDIRKQSAEGELA